MKSISEAAELAKKGLEAVGIGLSAGFAVEFLKGVNEATANMKELGVVAGTTAEAISRFELPARAAGTSLDVVALSMSRLSKAIVEAQDPATKSAAALHAIGLSAQDFKNLKPDEAFILVSKALATYSDGIGKNAVMQALLARSSGDVKKVLAEIAEGGELNATVTNKQAEEANALNKSLVELKMQSEQLWRGLVAEGVPAVTQILKAFTDARKEMGLVEGAIAALSTAFESLLGTPEERMRQELATIEANVTAINEWQVASQGYWVSEGTRAEQAKNLNTALTRRQEILLALKGIEDERARAAAARAAGQPSKPDPHMDPMASQTDAAYVRMLADATRELATAQAQQLAGATPLTEAEKKLIAVEADPKWKELTPTQQALVKSKLEHAKVIEQTTAADKAYAEAAAAANAIDEQTLAEITAILDKGKERLLSLDVEIDAYKRETAILGAGNLARELLNLDLQREHDLRGVVNESTRDGINAKYDELKVLTAQRDAIQQQLSVWNQIGDAVGQAFSSMFTQGTRAIDALRNLVKQLLADMISVFAKRWVLSLAAAAAGGSGTPAGAALMNAAGSAGQGSIGGALVDYFSGNNTQTGQYYGPGSMEDFKGTGYEQYAQGPGLGQQAMGAVGGAFTGYGVGSAFNTLFGNSRNQTGTTVGGTIGGAIGSIWGPIGALIGSFLGSAIGSLFKSGGGAKEQGAFAGTYNSQGHLVSSLNGQDITQITGDNQHADMAQTGATNTALGFVAMANALGLKPGNMQFGLGFSTDPKGTAPGFIHNVVRDASGNAVYQHFDDNAPRDAGQFQAEMQLESSRAILAALKASDMPDYLKKVFDGLTPDTATQAQIDAAMQMATALKSIYDVASREPLTDAAQAFSDSMDQFDAALKSNGMTMRGVMDAYDGTSAAATNLQQATLAYYNAQVQLLNQLTAAKQSIDNMFGDTFRGFKLAGMDDQGKYDFYQKEAKDLTAQALASTDPAEIQRLVGLITQDEQAAFALLTPEQQAGAAGQSFISQGSAAQHAIDSHLDDIKQSIADATKDTLDEIKSLIAGPTDSMNSAANTLNGAANTINNAANTPLHVIVDNAGGGQEVTG